jgi:Tol biopolymer transport system component
MKALRLVLLALALLGLVTALVGCSGSSSAPVFLNVFQRASWAQELNGRLTLSAYGGNGITYVYTIASAGGSLSLITPSQNNVNNLLEGGQHPVYSPAPTTITAPPTIAFASRRNRSGNTGNSLALYTMSAITGDVTGLVRVTSDAGAGADLQPNYSPDGTKLIYSSTRTATGLGQIRTANANGSSNSFPAVFTDGFDDQWPCYNPKNPNQVVYQSTRGAAAGTTSTSLWIYNLSGATFTQVTSGNFMDGAPSWSPDGTTIAFHSNRSSDYDIWTIHPDGTALTHVTNDSRSDGFPVWSLDNVHLAFTRDRELWTTTIDGVTQTQLTQRF